MHMIGYSQINIKSHNKFLDGYAPFTNNIEEDIRGVEEIPEVIT